MEFEGRQIQFVAGLHGNEKAPVRALRDMNIDFLLGNPIAYEKNARYTDTDLNASFGTNFTGYEHLRAQEILKEVSSEAVVVDFHTTSAVTDPFTILVSVEMLPLAARTGLSNAVLMSHNIKESHALINHRDGISVELSGYDTQESYEMTRRVIEHLVSGESVPLTVYEVYERITEPGDYVNFVDHAHGFIPILVGEESYDFIGLKARRLD